MMDRIAQSVEQDSLYRTIMDADHPDTGAPYAWPEEGLADEILAWASERLAKFKRPKTIDFVEALPREANGKLKKRLLRDPYWEGRDRAI